MGSWVEARKLAFSVCRGTGLQSATADRLSTWHWTHRRRLNRGMRWRWWARTHTAHGYGKRGPWASEKRDGVAYVMPDWAGKMASTCIYHIMFTESRSHEARATLNTYTRVICFWLRLKGILFHTSLLVSEWTRPQWLGLALESGFTLAWSRVDWKTVCLCVWFAQQ